MLKYKKKILRHLGIEIDLHNKMENIKKIIYKSEEINKKNIALESFGTTIINLFERNVEFSNKTDVLNNLLDNYINLLTDYIYLKTEYDKLINFNSNTCGYYIRVIEVKTEKLWRINKLNFNKDFIVEETRKKILNLLEKK